MKRFIWASLFSAAVIAAGACNGDDDGDGDGDTDTDTDTDTDSDTYDSTVAPVLSDATVTCLTGSCSSGNVWQFSGSYTDPQGDDNVLALQDIVVTNPNGGEITTLTASCGGGSCSTSGTETQMGGLGCTQHENYTFITALEDADGNIGPEVEWVWFED